MVDLQNTSPADIFTVFLRDDFIGGVAYGANLPQSMIWSVTCRSVPDGCPFVMMYRADVPPDYDTNPDFAPDWDNPDGYGGCQ